MFAEEHDIELTRCATLRFKTNSAWTCLKRKRSSIWRAS